jgi:carboxymethylenebutenolidase
MVRVAISSLLWVSFLLVLGCVSTEEERSADLDQAEQATTHDIYTEEINYFEDSSGWLAKPLIPGVYPGIVLIHEWWGLNKNIKEISVRLASQGYIVLAVDLFNGRIATTSEEAQQLSSSVDDEKAIDNMQSAAANLKNQQQASAIASIGWCFGGGRSLQLALSGQKMDATVIYYGNLVTDESKLIAINWPVLGIFGNKDSVISVADVNDFDLALDKLGIENEIYIYEDVGHAFANPSNPDHDLDKATDALKKTMTFLDKHLK